MPDKSKVTPFTGTQKGTMPYTLDHLKDWLVERREDHKIDAESQDKTACSEAPIRLKELNFIIEHIDDWAE